jgi:hypothetical protein
VLIGKISKHVGIDRMVAQRLRVLLQTDPAEPTVDVQVQSSWSLVSASFSNGRFQEAGFKRQPSRGSL